MRFLRVLFILLLALLLGTPSCRPQTPETADRSWMANPARRSEFELIQVLTPARGAAPLVQALRSELKTDFDVHVLEVTPDMPEEELARALQASKPSAVVVVDNPTVALYGRWARAQKTPPPSIIAMASFAEELRATVPNSTGIAFEPPAVTVLSDMRRLINSPIRRAGVVYRKGFESFIIREQKRLALEKIELVPVAVPQQPSPRSVAWALRQLEKEDVQAIWVSNDNVLLSQRLLSQAWLPHARDTEVPILVGVPSLVTSSPHFGTYAAVPDIEGLGMQAADLVYDLQAAKWSAKNKPVQPPLSIRTYVDVKHARRLGMTPQNEATVDVLITGGNR